MSAKRGTKCANICVNCDFIRLTAEQSAEISVEKKILMVSSSGETVEADVEELNHGWPRTIAGWATSRSQRHNLVAHRLNLRWFAFLYLLLLISIGSADQLALDDCDDRGEDHCVPSNLKEYTNMVGSLRMLM
ncbi:hypothetical protein L2E82_18322 [Cichorium intybus]|uniref:Uncharacterized protein n=1 Tax=Cichorium intybus TaxID=13427 RepID=A0ACB9FAH0_CICIN|nr:hypothetical protein L2E82_18322 [Cichorium intybus]